MLQKLKAMLHEPVYFFTSAAAKGMLNWMPDAWYLKILYRWRMGEPLNLRHPKKYNEKLQWLKLYDRNPAYAGWVDKYEVRSYIAKKLGEEYLIPCYGVWDRFEDIDFDALPDAFVLKCTHDSGSVILCRDKAAFDKAAAAAQIARAFKRNYYNAYREWPYKSLKPRIIAEKFMVDESGSDLKDYKVLCFSGRARMVELHQNRFQDKAHTQDFYDRDWNNLHIVQAGFPGAKEPLARPAKLEELLRLSEILAEGIRHVRVDWYVADDRIYFGEITFYDGSGFEAFTEKDEYYLGSLIKL